MAVDEAGGGSEWSREQDKAFENALATYPEDSSDRWESTAADVPGKTLEEIKQHYELLEDDVNQIESGGAPLPPYNSSDRSAGHACDEGNGKKGSGHFRHCTNESNHGNKNSSPIRNAERGLLGHRMSIVLGMLL